MSEKTSRRELEKNADITSIKKGQVTVIALFRNAPNAKNVKRELENLRKQYRETIFYKTLKEPIS